MQAIDASENVDFNLHTHVECNSPLLPDSKTIVISTHALTWSATSWIRINSRNPIFQLTHSRGVRQLYLDSLCDPDNFNSRTHVECDIGQKIELIFREISTHALTWSATCPLSSWSACDTISTHALTWSATCRHQ